eukprot:20180-Pyramimonas_sp.AAC.1
MHFWVRVAVRVHIDSNEHDVDAMGDSYGVCSQFRCRRFVDVMHGGRSYLHHGLALDVYVGPPFGDYNAG